MLVNGRAADAGLFHNFPGPARPGQRDNRLRAVLADYAQGRTVDDSTVRIPVVRLPECLSAERIAVALSDIPSTEYGLLERVRRLRSADAGPCRIQELEQAVRGRSR